MRSITLFLFLVFLAFSKGGAQRRRLLGNRIATREFDADGDSLGSAALQTRIEANEVLISKLQLAVVQAEAELGKVESAVPDFDDLSSRVDKLAGHGCGENEFQCGGHSQQCVDTILVCDGSPDCDNSADEDKEQLCRNPVTEGSAWTAVVDWNDCITADTTEVHIMINEAVRRPNFQSRVWLTVTVHLQVPWPGGKKETLFNGRTTGSYDFGKRQLVLESAGPQSVGLVCDFDGHKKNHCEGNLVSASVHHPCAHAIFHKN